jgi:ankyrin repeat protein
VEEYGGKAGGREEGRGSRYIGSMNMKPLLLVLFGFGTGCREDPADLRFQLSLAAELGEVEVGLAALEAGAEVDGVGAEGQSALGLATVAGQFEFAQMLLTRGADPMSPDSFGYTPIDYAIERFQPELLDLFLATFGERNGPPEVMMEFFDLIVAGDATGARNAAEFLRDNSGDLSLISLGMVFASARGEADVLEQLLIIREEADGANSSGYTPLAMAARFGCLECVQLLEEDGADVNWETDSRYQTTALMEASRDGYTEIGTYLLAHGARINEGDVHGDHALNWAVLYGQTEFVAMLLDAGASTAIRGQTNEFALQIARREGHSAIVDLLTR